MKKSKNKTIRVLLLIVLSLSVVMSSAGLLLVKNREEEQPTKETVTAETILTETHAEKEAVHTYTPDEQGEYDAFVSAIEEGSSTAAAQMLLDGQVPDFVISRLEEEDAGLLDHVLAEALAEYTNQGNVENLVRLRLDGYVTDACLYDYWEIMGARLPEEDLEVQNAGADRLLVHELVLAYQRNDYAIRALRQMRGSGILDDQNHAELIARLGFDYTDDQYLQENNIAQLRDLNAEEKAAYDAVLVLADEGDGYGIAMRMVYGEVSELVFEKLMEADSEMMDYILAQAMGQFSEENNYHYSVLLRLNGFVSDDCFRDYWEIMGTDPIEGDRYDDNHPGVDRYLLHELEQIYHRDPEYGVEALRLIRGSGQMNDPIHELLIERLGFDYMVTMQ